PSPPLIPHPISPTRRSSALHYAEVKYDDDGNPELHRGNDMNKDQSYVLGVLTTEQLRHSYFPIGVSASKDDVRAEAAERGISVRSEEHTSELQSPFDHVCRH